MKTRNNVQRLMPNSYWACFLIVAMYADAAMANAALPVVAIAGPFLIALLVPIILLETWSIRRELGLSFLKCLKVVGIANVVSTVAGMPIAFGLEILYQFSLNSGIELAGISSTGAENFIASLSPIWQGLVYGILSPAFVFGMDKIALPMMIVSGAILWALCFILSWKIEFYVARAILKFMHIEHGNLNQAFKKTNAISYCALIVAWIGYSFSYVPYV